MTESVVTIVPTIRQLLTTVKDVKCTVDGCNKIFCHTGALHMHLTKSHRQIHNERDGRLFHKRKASSGDSVVHYNCPVEPCVYNKGSKKFFSTFALVKQHYRRVHAERKYVCTKCASSFCQDYDLQKHWAKCGVMYQCGSCSVDYTTKEALLMHCKTEKHVYPAEYQRQKKVEADIKKPKNQPQESSPAVITITQTPIIVIPSNALQTSLEKNHSKNILEVDHSSSSNMTIPENSHTNILSDRNDALVQTDIYGVETLNLSSTNDHSNSDNFNACNSHHVSYPQQYSVIDRPVKSPGRRQGQIKRRSVGGRDMNPGSPRRKKMKSTTGMQTSVSLTRKKAAAVVISTQTPGDFILQTAMKQADIKIQKRTIGSQVTPKKASSQGQSQLKSSEIQTFISGFRPQLVDSSSQVQQKNILSEVMAQNMSEQETMTELPLTAATQTPQSYLGGESANYNAGGGGAYHSSLTVDGNSNEPFSYNGKCPVSTTDNSVQIFSESFETSVKYQMPSTLRQETSGRQLFKGTASNLGGSEHTISNFSADNKLPTDLKTSDHEVQAMSASEFDTLLQSSGIFINNSDLLKQTSLSTVQPHTNFINSSKLDSQAANLDFLTIGTSMMDMNTQTGSDYNLFDELEAVDSNTQTPGDMDFIDLVMSNMETQTLNDDDLRSLGLMDTYTLPSTHTHSMAIGTSDFESNFSTFDSNPFIGHHANNTDTCTMGVGTSDFDKMEDAVADVGKKKVQNMYYAYKLSDNERNMISTDLESVDDLDPFKDNQSNESDHHKVVASEAQTITSGATGGEGGDGISQAGVHLCSAPNVSETQTQVDSTDTGFTTINMETQTTFEDLQQLCEMIK